ncbi:MAG TPA: nucleotidyltransferase family protein, partial [Candidatus Sulfotelmatobacter sp.]|nr:nucleotidyltransferase family protein [Candidatus Sulfotelmatobacter sp.]
RALSTRVRWGVLFDLAEQHGLQPLLYRSLSATNDLVPQLDMRRLAQLYQTNIHRSMLGARELIHLLDLLAENKIEVLTYKGLALGELAYGDIALRPVGDIDLLIHGEDLPRIREAVQPLGYVPHSALSAAEERASLRSGYEYVFDGPAGRNLLELKWGILPRFYAVDFDHSGFFRRALRIRVAGHEVRTLSREDLLLVLSIHAAKHVWERLIWLCDLARIMAHEELDWAWIGAQAKVLGIVRILRITLALASGLLGAEIPTAAQSSLPPDTQADALAHEITGYIADPQEYNTESVAYFRLMLRLRENQNDRLRFISRLILTPGPGEWAAIRLPEPLFPLYRLVRLGRLARRMVSS